MPTLGKRTTPMKLFVLALLLLFTNNARSQECYDLGDRSSWITGVCYNEGSMAIRMQGVDYQFCGVEYNVFAGLVRADSPGMFYDQFIRNRYGCQQQESNEIYWTDPRGVRMRVPKGY